MERTPEEQEATPAEPAEGRVGPEDMAPQEGPTDEVQADDHDERARESEDKEDNDE